MASMRVHELAKEFDMSSGDLLDRLKEMKIPAKSHASMLNDAYVDKIRKNLEPEIRARAGALEAEEAAALAAEQEEAERKRAEEEAERKAAREKELAEREAARARREGSRSDDDAEGEEHQARKQAPKQPSAFASLEQQIASEKERVERERQEARARARAEKAAAEVAKKRAVEEALRRGHKKPAKAAPAPVPARPAPAPAPSRPKNNFDSLLSQIEAEKQRMEAAKSVQADTRAPRGGKKGKKGGAHQVVPELEAQMTVGEDRYAQMAVQAEKLQRDKVLAEARAAVAAANTHEGEGRRKKRKEKREAEARERAELEAIERGLDPSLVLDDSVVEIPAGRVGGQVRRAAGRAAQRRHQAPVHARPGAHAHPDHERRDHGAHRRRHGPQGARRVAGGGVRRGVQRLRGRPEAASAGGHRHGPCRPRQDLAARRHPRHRRGGQRGRRHHPAHRRVPW